MPTLPLKTSLLSLAVALGLSLAAPLTLAADARDYLQDAREAVAEGKVREALIHLKNALQKDPRLTDARLLLGEVSLGASDAESAIKELERARDLGAARADWLPALGRAYLLGGHPERVLNQIETRDQDPPGLRATLLGLRGQAQLLLGRRVDAQSALQDALALDPGNLEALHGQAKLKAVTGDLAGALADWRQALAGDDQRADLWLLGAELLRRDAQIDEAATAYRQAMGLNRFDIRPAVGLIGVLLAQGELDAAGEVLDGIDRAGQNHPAVHYFRGLLAYAREEFQVALDAVNQALQSAPGMPPAQLLYGTLQYRQGNYAQTVEAMQQLLERAPEQLAARRLAAAALMRTGDNQRAYDLLRAGLDQAGEDAGYLSLAGSAALRVGKHAEGLELLTRAAQVAPEAGMIQGQLALGYLTSGQSDAAVATLERAIAGDKKLLELDLLLVLSHVERKEFDQAMQALEAMSGRFDDVATVENLRGSIHLAKGEREAARAAFRRAAEAAPERAAPRLNLAMAELAAGDQAAAIDQLDQILQADPQQTAALMLRARIAARETLAAAIPWLERIQVANPGEPRSAQMLVEALLAQDDALAAVGVARAAVDVHPNSANLRISMAKANLAAGNAESAVQALRRAAALTPNDPKVHNTLAMVLVQMGDSSQAVDSLERSLQLNPDDLAVMAMLGRAYLDSGRVIQARETVDKLIAAAPDSASVWRLQGDLQLRDERAAAAEKSYARALELSRNAEDLLRQYNAIKVQNDLNRGLALLADWTRRNPEDFPAWMLMGNELLAAGQRERAEAAYQRAVELQPESLVALNNLSWLLQQRGDLAQAADFARRAHEVAPERPEIQDTYGWILVEQGEVGRGLALIAQARSALPEEPSVWYHHAAALARNGERSKARRELERLLSSQPSFTERAAAEALLREL